MSVSSARSVLSVYSVFGLESAEAFSSADGDRSLYILQTCLPRQERTDLLQSPGFTVSLGCLQRLSF